MYPLPAHTVKLVLQYISPLTDHLPPHLISTPLRQRHHFLQISTSSPVEYLCWPSPDNAKIATFLDQLSSLSDQDTYSTRYTSDSESTFAHVQVSSDTEGLRILFLWDETDGWKYHDTQLMPFPSSSQDALATARNAHSGAVPARHPCLDLFAGADHDHDSGDESYWDAYATTGYDLSSSLELTGISKPDGEGEDAYWAQYASVQGSADSTIPSPLPNNRKLRPANPTDDDESGFPLPFPSQSHPIIDIPVHTIHSSPPVSRLGPPSPNTLTHLLTAISPRTDAYPLILDEPTSAFSSEDLLSDLTATDSELITPPSPDGHREAVAASRVAIKVNRMSLPPLHDEEGDRALTDSIRGLYFLWKSGKKGELSDTGSDAFLRIVQAAITRE